MRLPCYDRPTTEALPGYNFWRRYCLWRLVLIDNLQAGWLQVASARVSLPEAPLSFQRVRRAVRAWATRQLIFANATDGADLEKIARAHEPLFHMLL